MAILDTDSDLAILADFGQRLAKRRISMRLSQAELAERAGVGKRTVERIEAGLPKATIERISNGLRHESISPD